LTQTKFLSRQPHRFSRALSRLAVVTVDACSPTSKTTDGETKNVKQTTHQQDLPCRQETWFETISWVFRAFNVRKTVYWVYGEMGACFAVAELIKRKTGHQYHYDNLGLDTICYFPRIEDER
jgi:hypothetical protein